MKTKMNLHKLLSLLLALVMVVGMLPMGQVAYAESTLPTISNVVISSDGVLTWDAVEGAERYSISVANFGGYVDETSYNLKYQCNYFNTGSGTKKIHLVAEDADKKDIAEWYGSYDYVDDRPQLDAPQNIQLNGPIISWDPVPNATYYVVNIIGDTGKRHQVTDTFYIYDDLADGNSYFFVVAAYALEYRGNGTEKTMVYRKVLYPITVTNGKAQDGYMRTLTEAEQGTYVILTADDVPEGSVFRGWRLGGVEAEKPKNKVISFTMPGNAVTATALYGIPYTVTVENGICTATGTSTGQFFEGDTVHVTAHEAPEGYQLKGWTSSDVDVPNISVLTNSFTMPDKPVTVSAVYAPLPLTVTFDANGHGTAPSNQIVNCGEKANKPKDLTAEGYTFGGWYKDADCTMPFDFKNTPITEDITLYANWLSGIIHTVTFANGNKAPSTTSELPEPQLVADGNLVAKPEPDPTAEGWIFGGWMTDPTGYTGYFDFATETITKDITLYADWVHPYYVYFDANGGTGTMDPVAVIPGYNCTIPECGFTAPEGKQFKGWAFDANSTEVVQFTSFEVSGGDKTLYAIWEDATTYIDTVDVTVREPVAGDFPQDAVSNTDNVSVSNTVWWHNGEVMSSSEYFVAGETYRVQVTLETDSGYVFKDGVIVSFNGYKTIMFCGDVVQITDYEEFTATAASAGYTVSGTATSFGSETEDITVELYAEGSASADYTVTVKGNSASYTIEGVAPGTYTMKVMKKNHVSREYTVTVSAENVTQDVKTYLLGDINGDGVISVQDALLALQAAVDKYTPTAYEQKAGDVNADGTLDVSDALLILQKAVDKIQAFPVEA